ncbi:MAG: glutamyl-tRNA synthetase [Acidithiobacillales bacterium SG8_45]|nr:MAG: glutamyl-tRNA synthetase [Acidithiobacillales bacterium SG8_45]
MEISSIKTRFAPSPTGLLHLGNVRTALFNYLLSASSGGKFLLRLEDTDAVRGDDKYAEALQVDLRWLGMDWHEGPGAGGEHGPYAQSDRGEIYANYFNQLIEAGSAYPCFCSEHELKLSRKAQAAAGKPPRYSGKCRGLSQDEVASYFAEGKPATLRFRVPPDHFIEFDDRVRGPQRFASDDIGDFIIRRSDHTPAFFFSNAVDDALMKVTLVVRGEDHLTNTPRQLMLLDALGLEAPTYAHIALVVGQDGAPLSKRNGSQTVQELRERGYLPEAVINYLARLGHTYESNDFLLPDALASQFDVGRLNRAPARFDLSQLLHWQREAVARADDDALWQWMNSVTIADARVSDLVPEPKAASFVQTIRENIETPSDAFLWAANLFTDSGVYDHSAREAIQAAGAEFFQQALTLLADAGEFRDYSRELAEVTGNKGKSLFMPLRAAISGEHDQRHAVESRWHDGPQMGSLWQLLDPATRQRRLELARAIASES